MAWRVYQYVSKSHDLITVFKKPTVKAYHIISLRFAVPAGFFAACVVSVGRKNSGSHYLLLLVFKQTVALY